MTSHVNTNSHQMSKEITNSIAEYVKELKDATESITISSDHLKDIVDTVLNVSSLESQDSEIVLQNIVFEPSEVIKSVVSMFKAKVAEKKITITCNFPENHLVVSGDPYRFKVNPRYHGYHQKTEKKLKKFQKKQKIIIKIRKNSYAGCHGNLTYFIIGNSY